MGSSDNPTPLTQRAIQRLAQADADILGSMMLIDMQIANCLNLNIEEAMLGKQRQHMIQKTNPSCCLGSTRTINRQAKGNIGLTGFAANCRAA
jgi:hypothetical protein